MTANAGNDRMMSVGVLELQRARKTLDAFCERRNRNAPGADSRIRCHQEYGDLYLGDSEPFRPLVKLSFANGCWFVYVKLTSGDWQAYPHLPCTDSFQAVVDEFEQAPLHVHWG